jgi:hypothetical protein
MASKFIGRFYLPIRSKLIDSLGNAGCLALPAYQNRKENAMPRIDELLGVATLAAAGMAIALALEPLPRGAVVHAHRHAPVVAVQPAAAPIVRLPSINVVARRSAKPELNLAASPAPLPKT